MRNQIEQLTNFHHLKTNLLLERLEEAEAQITLLRCYVENDENQTVHHGLNLLQASLEHLLQAVRLKPDFVKGGENA